MQKNPLLGQDCATEMSEFTTPLKTLIERNALRIMVTLLDISPSYLLLLNLSDFGL